MLFWDYGVCVCVSVCECECVYSSVRPGFSPYNTANMGNPLLTICCSVLSSVFPHRHSVCVCVCVCVCVRCVCVCVLQPVQPLCFHRGAVCVCVCVAGIQSRVCVLVLQVYTHTYQ